MKIKKNGGITLIALVITIIILLILAGVALSLVIGENGILTKVKVAKETHEKEALKEQVQLITSQVLIEQEIDKKKIDRMDVAKEIQKQIGGVLEGPRVVTSDNKYDIYVKTNLQTIVKEHQELTPSNEFETQELSDGTVAIIKYNGTSEEITIPEEIEVDGEYKTVTQIGTDDGDNIIDWKEGFFTKVTLPSTLKRIEDYALGWTFYDEAGAQMEIPEGVEYLGISALEGNGFIGIKIPNTVLELEYDVFSNNKLKTIGIPNRISKIPSEYASYNELTEVIIPDNVTEIGEKAFIDNRIGKLQMSKNIKSIGTCAFNNNLLPDSQAFIYEINEDGTSDFTKLIGYGGAKEDITIPNNVTTIGESAFKLCSRLKNVIILNNVTKIEKYAFASCTSLTNVIIPSTVTYIGFRCFGSTSATIKIDKPEGSISGAPWANSGTIIWNDTEI